MPETNPEQQDYFTRLDLPKLSEMQSGINGVTTLAVGIVSATTLTGVMIGYSINKEKDRIHQEAQIKAQEFDVCGKFVLKNTMSTTKKLTISVDELNNKPEIVKACDLSVQINNTVAINRSLLRSATNVKPVSITLPSRDEIVRTKERYLEEHPSGGVYGLVVSGGFGAAIGSSALLAFGLIGARVSERRERKRFYERAHNKDIR